MNTDGGSGSRIYLREAEYFTASITIPWAIGLLHLVYPCPSVLIRVKNRDAHPERRNSKTRMNSDEHGWSEQCRNLRKRSPQSLMSFLGIPKP
mgnify:FL=1